MFLRLQGAILFVSSVPKGTQGNPKTLNPEGTVTRAAAAGFPSGRVEEFETLGVWEFRVWGFRGFGFRVQYAIMFRASGLECTGYKFEGVVFLGVMICQMGFACL